MDQEAAPLYEGLLAYQSHGLLGFHTPGHTGGRTFALGDLAALELTEVPFWPEGPGVTHLVAQAERLAADLFGAGTTFFLTNGATAGILAMLLGSCPPGTPIAVGRDCHRSVVAACILGDLHPVFLPSQYREGWSFPFGTSAAELGKALAGPAPVLATNPSYQGVIWDLRPLADVSGSLLVDEAHGAHLIFHAGAGGGPRQCPGLGSWFT